MDQAESAVIGMVDFVKVHAGAEGWAICAQQDGANFGIAVSAFQGFNKSAAKLQIEGVAFLRTVQRKTQQPAV
jgi:hypothetical protein